MKFKQTYNIEEHGWGRQTIQFAVSDTYSELFQASGSETDVFDLETVKKDLNTEEGKFAIDEMQFKIHQGACIGETDLNALYFCLHASDVKVNRYCAVFFLGEDLIPDKENLRFIGRISDQISGTDILWQGADFDVIEYPEREYNFKCLSFDVSVLLECKMTQLITKKDPETGLLEEIDNIYDRIEGVDYEHLFSHRLSYATRTISGSITRYAYLKPLGNLFDILVFYLAKAEEVLYDYLGDTVNLTLVESDLGLQVRPVEYLHKTSDYDLFRNYIQGYHIGSPTLKLVMKETVGAGETAPYIHRRMLDPKSGHPEGLDEKTDNLTKRESFIKEMMSNEETLSFKSLDNVADLIYGIARAFGCYVKSDYNITNEGVIDIRISFIPMESLVETDYTKVISADSGKLDVSSVLSSDMSEYYAYSTNYTRDGEDTIRDNWASQTAEVKISNKLKDLIEKNKYKNENEDTKAERLILSTSITINDADSIAPMPLNTVTGTALNQTDNYIQERWERLHNAIYMKARVNHTDNIYQALLLNGQNIWRPVGKVYAKVENEIIKGNDGRDGCTLTEFVNTVSGRAKTFYKSEYELEVPSWNGFVKDGQKSWRNIKLGSKIKVLEKMKYLSVGGIIDGDDIENDYVVIGLEISLKQPLTKIKLHRISRFAFSPYKTDEEPEPVSEPPLYIINNVLQLVDDDVTSYIVSDTIESGDVVMINDDGTIRKYINLSENYGKVIGIAVDGGGSGEIIRVKSSGIVHSVRYDLTGRIIFARRSSGCNVTDTPLTDKTADEDVICIIGKRINQNEFLIDIEEMVLI